MNSAGKRQKSTSARAATAGPCCSCQQDSPCNLDDPGAHVNEQGGGRANRNRTGASDDEGSRYGMAKVNRQAKPAEQGRCRQTQPADDPTGTGLEAKLLQTIRPIQASQQNNSHRCWPASRRAVQVGGGSAVVLATRKAGSDLPTCLPPTYRLCLSLSIPTPLICTNPI